MSQNSLVQMLPRYQRVRWELERYLSGLEVGQKIMTEHELVEKFQVSRVTTRRALQFLRDEGIIESVRGRGTFYVKAVTLNATPIPVPKLLGLLVPSVNAPTIGEIVHGVETEATRRGYHIILTHDHSNPDLQIAQLRNMLNANVAGILLYPDGGVTDHKEFLELLAIIDEQKMPLVLLDRYIPGLNFPCVMTDNVRGAYQATEHLICSGRRRLALIGFWATNTVHVDRRKGFVEALRDYNLPLKPVLEGETHAFGSCYDLTAKWIKGCKSAEELPFDGIVCMSDLRAYEAFSALQDAGFQVPEDVALVGYDNLNASPYCASGLQLTSVQQPLEQIGLTAAGLLIDQLENKPRIGSANHVILPPKLVVRTSCGTKSGSQSAVMKDLAPSG